MAGRKLLGDLIAKYEATSPQRVALECVGGVDAAKRVRAGEPLDVAVLSREAIDELIGAGLLDKNSLAEPRELEELPLADESEEELDAAGDHAGTAGDGPT